MARPRGSRSVALELSTQLEREVRALTSRASLAAYGRLRGQIDEAADAMSRHIAHALETDREQDFARHIRRARASATDIRDGLQTALTRRCVSEADLRQFRQLLGRLYPVLNSLLVLTVSFTPRLHRPWRA